MNKEKKDRENIVSKIINNSLDKIMSEKFGRYSKYIIQQRALPDVRDGLKPVHRRILYAMSELGLFSDKPYKKSARIVGDVIGKYHPHGDTSVYDAMINMSQWWKMGVPLLDMHGNVGSIDNDPAAAMRYTEVRMSKVCDYMLADLKKKTVDFVPNFDDSESEPVVLPTIFPNLLVNGSTGIAIGMATEMPPHNLNEIIEAVIAKLQNPNASLETIKLIVQGPDFSTGGIIYGKKGIYEAFENGRLEKEKIKLFSKYKVYKKGKNKFIEITEIPYGVVKSQLVYDIDLIISKETVDGLLEIKDQSDRDGICILITLEEDANEQSILNFLFQKTNLQVNYSYNNVVIRDNSPRLLGIQGLLDAYIEHIKIIKTRTLTYDLEKHKLRLEIVLGFLKVAEITDQVIAVIRKSEGSKAGVIKDLIESFNFTKNQATAIAELRLYRLSKTDKETFLKEKEELEKQINYISDLLGSKMKFTYYLIGLLKEMSEKMGYERRTQIIDNEYEFNYSQKDLVKEESVNIGISKDGYLKRLSQKIIDLNDFSTYHLKNEDYLIYYNKASTINTFVIFTNLGNYAIIPIYKIADCKWKDLGGHLSDFVDLKPGENVVSVIETESWDVDQFVVIATKEGMIKKTYLKDFEVTRLLRTYTAITLNPTDEVVNVCLSDGTKDVILVTSQGYGTKYSENDVNIYGTRAKGIKGIYLSSKDYVTAFTVAKFNDVLTLITDEGLIKKMRAKDIYYVQKTNKGKELFKNRKYNPYHVTEIYATRDTDYLIIKDTKGNSYLDPVKQYIFSKTDDTFSKLKVDNYYSAVIRKTMKAEKGQNITLQLGVLNEKEEKKFSEAEKHIDTIELSVDELIKKINLTLEKSKK